jgi:hypothetical protein
MEISKLSPILAPAGSQSRGQTIFRPFSSCKKILSPSSFSIFKLIFIEYIFSTAISKKTFAQAEAGMVSAPGGRATPSESANCPLGQFDSVFSR